MKKQICFIVIPLLLTAGCEKYLAPEPGDPDPSAVTLPFENDILKISLVTDDGPVNTRNILFMDALKGFAVTFYGEIHKTVDGGVNWTQQYKNPVSYQSFYKVFFTDENTGYVVGGSNSCGGTGCIPPGGVILKSVDGGTTWSRIFELPGREITSITTNSTGELFATARGANSEILWSNDEGTTWTVIESAAFQLNGIIFNENFGFCSGVYGNILRTNNDGDSWELISTPDALYVSDVKFSDNSVLCVMSNMRVYRADEEGKNWLKVFDSDRSFYGLDVPSNDTWVMHGNGGYSGGCWGYWYAGIGYTTNSGADWSVVTVRAVPALHSSSFYSDKEGFMIGGTSGGYLLKVTLK